MTAVQKKIGKHRECQDQYEEEEEEDRRRLEAPKQEIQERKFRNEELVKDNEERQVLFRRRLTNQLKCGHRVHCQRGLGLHHKISYSGEDDQTDLLQANRIQSRRPDCCWEGGHDWAPREGLEDQADCQRDAEEMW